MNRQGENSSLGEGRLVEMRVVCKPYLKQDNTRGSFGAPPIPFEDEIA